MRLILHSILLLSLSAMVACNGKDADDTGEGTEPNSPPVAEDDSADSWSGLTVEIDVLDNDSDEDDYTLEITEVTQPDNGTVEILTSGTDSVEYTSDEDFEGEDTFTYTISDGNGGTDSATVTVTVTGAPTLIITAPEDDDVVDGSEVTVEFEVDGCNVSSPSSDEDGCHLHKYLDGKQYTDEDGTGFGHYDDGSFTISPVSDGEHSFSLQLIANDGSDEAFDPLIDDSVTFTVVVSDTGDTADTGYTGSSQRGTDRGWRFNLDELDPESTDSAPAARCASGR